VFIEGVGVAQGMSAGDVILTAEAEYAANYVAFLQVRAPGSARRGAWGEGRGPGRMRPRQCAARGALRGARRRFVPRHCDTRYGSGGHHALTVAVWVLGAVWYPGVVPRYDTRV
jgi:hypothetical protein